MITIRKIEAQDDPFLAEIAQINLKKVHLDIPGTAYFDPELFHLSKYYMADPIKRCYFTAISENGEVVGGVGIAEFSGFENCAEMQKLYLADHVKGKGYGKKLVTLAENWARSAGYEKLYLETHSFLEVAIFMYEKMGFKRIEKPAGVVHSTMDHFYIKEL